MENNKSNNNFFSGFLLGALVGAAIALLFVTKKGKKILKAISEEGEGKISKMLNKLEDQVELDKDIEDEAPLVDASVKQEKSLVPDESVSKKKIAEDKPKIRRFFRGVSRHVN